MKSPYSFIVCADIRYLPEWVALANSLSYVGNKQDMHFYGYKIPQEVIDQFPLLGYNVIFHNISDEELHATHGLSEVVCRKRYYFANEIGQDYQSVCVLDADMVFCRDPILYFEIAAKTGLVLCAVKEQKQSYDDPHHQAKGEWIIPEGTQPTVDLCNCPLFVDTHVWGKALKESFEVFMDGFPDTNFKGPDMAAMNILLYKYGSNERTIGLPNSQWLGTNEQNCKPYIRAVGDGNSIKTETGTPIYSFHGQYFYPRWRNCQLANRHRCAGGYLKANKSEEVQKHMDEQAKGVMDMLYGRFKKMLDYKIQIPKINYRHPEKETGYLDVTSEEDFQG